MRQNILFQEAPHCGVGQSKICDGQGLFALKEFQRNELVVNYKVTETLRKQYPFSELPEIAKDSCWWIGISKEIAEVFPPESIFMRANHSRKPNCLWSPIKQTLTALREIFPGEEITYDYRLEIAPDYIKSNPPNWA